ncbi:hypothetical protein [Actinoplanes palleronii]|uniref:Uncharacterized protein n=1 Tax=Actinoplanes palleronii TaxID=113570 RepID=A0ABQ4BT21_9ACTN|nr:hypothetical protein [Actinoplanes palleronii]GIE73827.1 hypothetical protein Apa02nite_099350 [Actinoplanes palleronii]
MTNPVIAERLLLATRVDCCFQLDEPTFIAAGESYWLDDEHGELCVARGNGQTTRHSGSRRHGSSPGDPAPRRAP